MKKRLYGLAVLVICMSFSGAAFGAAFVLTAVEELGKSIFFDMNLSINKNQSCAVCHGPEVGWTGPHPDINAGGAVYEGSITGRFGDRKPPSSAYATQSPIFHLDKKGLFVGGNFWDGRATGELLGNPAADQALGPFLNPMEQALPDSACVVYRVCNPDYPVYPVLFEEVWGDEACEITWPKKVDELCAKEGTTLALSPWDRAKSYQAFYHIGLSIAAYEASPEVNAFTSKYDLFLAGTVDLTMEEKQGLNLFKSKGKCANCHILDPGPNGELPLLTDYTFDNLGIPQNPENPRGVAPAFVDPGLGGFLSTVYPLNPEVYGPEWGKHKVPTLRNVDLRPDPEFKKAYGHNGYLRNVDLRPDPEFKKAYGHNGYFKSLEGIVHFYNTRDIKPVCDDEYAYTEAQALAADCWPAAEVPENVNTDKMGDLGLTPEEEDAIVAFLWTLSDGYQALSQKKKTWR